MVDRLHICQTCERGAVPDGDGRTRGERLTASVRALLADGELGASLTLRCVPCLSGCPNPCNVAFRAPGKVGLRFSHLAAGDAADLVAFAELYLAAPTGEVEHSLWPASLSGRLTATTPVPPFAARGSV